MPLVVADTGPLHYLVLTSDIELLLKRVDQYLGRADGPRLICDQLGDDGLALGDLMLLASIVAVIGASSASINSAGRLFARGPRGLPDGPCSNRVHGRLAAADRIIGLVLEAGVAIYQPHDGLSIYRKWQQFGDESCPGSRSLLAPSEADRPPSEASLTALRAFFVSS